jgi:hypothetical protein
MITVKSDNSMNQYWEHTEHPRGYYACLVVMLSPIIIILMLPVAIFGIDQLPYAFLMCAFVVLPLLSCGRQIRGRPLFQSSYHGTPFVEEVMDISEDENVSGE